MKTANNWDSVQLDETLLDDNLMKTIFVFPTKLSSRGTTKGKPVQGIIYIDKEKSSPKNSGKFR
jgi:hypothetical protein